MPENTPPLPRRMPKDSIRLLFAGEIILPETQRKDLGSLFHRYQLLFEYFANMPLNQRLINYKILNGLILTSHAKKITDLPKRKHIFELKNKIFLNLANDYKSRKMLLFKYLTSKHFRVIEFCEDCIKANSDTDKPKHLWKFCKKCQVDKNFYNVLSMYHRSDKGHGNIFISNDLIPQVTGLKIRHKGKTDNHSEEMTFDKYHYTIKNLDAISLESAVLMNDRLLSI